ncbi:MAG: FAD-dependent oxidoreductase [Nocardioidaceae bacterium]|nr:FAD-dependent oxidoreductase [Nocardioidaceae bacterium]
MHRGATRPRVAVVGSGVSGLTAAYLLRRTHEVTLFEVDDRLGGHAHTHGVHGSDGRNRDIDSGFIVHNDRTYPLLRRLFAELDVQVHPSEMSMSIHCDGCGLEYAGGRGPKGLFAQPQRIADPRYLRLLRGVTRFQKLAGAFLDAAEHDDLTTYGEFLERHGFDTYFVDHYAIPVVSCVWSSGHETALAYPTAYLFRFLRHHGFLTLKDSPQWYTVAGGSRVYVDKVAAALDDVRVGVGAARILREDDSVLVQDTEGAEHRVDHVVIATHADDALDLLDDASVEEKRVLSAFRYSRNETVLHTDTSLLPSAPRARSSWNYRMGECHERRSQTTVSYWMNRLQGHTGPEEYVVTLNASERIDPESVVARMEYTHPVYTPESVAAQRELAALASPSTVFAGAYHGWGFHEDGCRSGVDAARHLGIDLGWAS